MERHFLKDGGWVDIRGTEEVTARGRRAIQAIGLSLKDFLMSNEVEEAAKFTDLPALTEEQADALLRLQEAVVVAAVAGWSYPGPAPTMQSVGDLPAGRFDEIAELSRHLGASLALDAKATAEPDPKGSSGVSAPSAGRSKAGQA